MASSWSVRAVADLEKAGVILHKTVNGLRSCAVSVVKSTIHCIKKIICWIDQLTSPQLDHESRKLLKKLREDLKSLRVDAIKVLQSFKDLAEIASDEYRIGCIKKEMEKRSPIRRAVAYVQNKFSRNHTSSELKMFVTSVHDHILICTDAVKTFSRRYNVLLTNIERVIKAKDSKLSELKTNVERKTTANAVSNQVAATAWTSGVTCWVIGAVASVFTGGTAVAGLAATGFMISWFACAGSAIASDVTACTLNISLCEYNYLKNTLREIQSIQKEMGLINKSILEMDALAKNAEDVLDVQLNHYTEQLSYQLQDTDRENIEESLDELHDYMKDLIETIESCKWNTCTAT